MTVDLALGEVGAEGVGFIGKIEFGMKRCWRPFGAGTTTSLVTASIFAARAEMRCIPYSGRYIGNDHAIRFRYIISISTG